METHLIKSAKMIFCDELKKKIETVKTGDIIQFANLMWVKKYTPYIHFSNIFLNFTIGFDLSSYNDLHYNILLYADKTIVIILLEIRHKYLLDELYEILNNKKNKIGFGYRLWNWDTHVLYYIYAEDMMYSIDTIENIPFYELKPE